MPRRVYLDHHAATPLAPGVREAMGAAHEQAWANASSTHAEGRAARARLESSRRALASALGVSAADLVFTAGGTEACNLGVLGLLDDDARAHASELLVLTSSLEHPAIERAVAQLADAGARVHALPLHEPDAPAQLRACLAAEAPAKHTLLVAQAVSHETGTCLDLTALAAAMPEGVSVIVDACQALGKLPIERFVQPGWAIALGGAKIGASAASGALIVPRHAKLSPRALGGMQERGRRAGTPDVAAMAGLAVAAEQLGERLAQMPRVGTLRDRLEQGLVALGGVVNGARFERVSTVTNVSFEGWRKATLVAAFDLEGVAVSQGAACSSGVDAPSSVIRALHPSEPWRAESCVRLSLGLETTPEDVDVTLAAAQRVLSRRPS